MKFSFEIKINKYIVYPALLTSFIFGGFIYLTPYLSILGFKSAIESKDTEAARKYIDFPSVRRSLKDQLNETLTKRLAKDMEGTPYSAFKMVLIQPMVSSLVNSTVNSTVTPNGLEALMNSGRLSKKKVSTQEKSQPEFKPTNKSKISMYYKTINRFILRSDLPNIEEPMKAYWKRDFLWSWKLTSIELPFELMSNVR